MFLKNNREHRDFINIQVIYVNTNQTHLSEILLVKHTFTFIKYVNDLNHVVLNVHSSVSLKTLQTIYYKNHYYLNKLIQS